MKFGRKSSPFFWFVQEMSFNHRATAPKFVAKESVSKLFCLVN